MAQPNQVTLEIDSDGAEEPAPRSNTNLLPGAVRPVATNRGSGNLGLGDRLNSVFREIRPLVEHARMRNNSRLSLPTWLPRQNSAPATSEAGPHRPQSSVAHVNLGPAAQTYVIADLETSPQNRPRTQPRLSVSTSNDSPLTEQAQDVPEINISVNPANNNNIHDNTDNESQSDDGHQVVDLRSTLNLLVIYAPFYFILFVKFMYDMREGLFTFFILFCTFCHSNSLVRREHGKQVSRSLSALLFELFFTIGCVGIVHFLFGHGKLLPNIVIFPGYKESIDIWELLWLVILTDLIVKILTVDIKILVTILPAVVLPFQKRGKVYLFVEAISQLYRSLLTIQPWMFYLMQSYEGSERMVGLFLGSVYVIAKVIEVMVRLVLFKNATWTLLQSVDLGTKPTCDQMLSVGDTCAICHDEYTAPVRLECSHIFCELCIAAWLDREHTCPLCRAKVADEPMWRDGSTTYDFQLY